MLRSMLLEEGATTGLSSSRGTSRGIIRLIPLIHSKSCHSTSHKLPSMHSQHICRPNINDLHPRCKRRFLCMHLLRECHKTHLTRCPDSYNNHGHNITSSISSSPRYHLNLSNSMALVGRLGVRACDSSLPTNHFLLKIA